MSIQDNPNFYRPESEILREAREIIDKKPFAPLRIGYELRNEDELADIQDILETQAPDALMWGFAGGRRREGTYLKPYYQFADRFGLNPDTEISENFNKFLLEATSNLGFGDLIDLKPIGIKYTVPLSVLMRDLDILTVMNSARSFSTWKRFKWDRIEMNRSGMQIDLFQISPDTVINADNVIYSNVFRDSFRIKF